MKKIVVLNCLMVIFLFGCTPEEIEATQDFEGEWLLKEWKLYWSENDMTELFELPDLSNSVFEVSAGGGYVIREESNRRRGKVFPFLIFTEPKYYRKDSSEAIGHYEVLSSGDLMFNIGTDTYFTRLVRSTKDSLVLETYSDFDVFNGGSVYFYTLGLVAGAENAFKANVQGDFSTGSELGNKYGLYNGFVDKYQDLYDAAGIEPNLEGFLADPLRAYAQGFTKGINDVLTNADPLFTDGFQQAELVQRTIGQSLATQIFRPERKVYRVRYFFVRK